MKISICIPTYNQGAFLAQAIQSAYNQTLLPIEIIVFDDCSTDNTYQVLQELQPSIPILTIYRQPTNVGISRNVDACLRAGTGDYIIRLDSDDCLLPAYAETLAKKLDEYPEAGYAHADVQEIDKNSNPLNVRQLYRRSGFQAGNEALRAASKGYKVAANIIMFRKTALEKVGYITSPVNFAEDFYLSAELAAVGYGNVYINQILSCYRVWLDGGNVRQKRKLTELIGMRTVFEGVLEPAYQQRTWSTKDIDSAKVNLASNQAECLQWTLFSESEKKELIQELFTISSSPKVKLMVLVYQSPLKHIFLASKRLNYVARRAMKKWLVRLR